jgi:hypothetical protein
LLFLLLMLLLLLQLLSQIPKFVIIDFGSLKWNKNKN